MPAIRTTRCLIIGSGPAGYTAAVYAARALLEPMIRQRVVRISGMRAGSQ